tara:strand:- start:63 stop:914 length:852 start_codon:yes stop_codon:yes gene_type:complete
MTNKATTIAFQGVHGAHADLACRKGYPYLKTIPCKSFDAALDAVQKGDADYCMIPIENSKAGRVAEIHNILPDTELFIISEHFVRIEHHLMAPKGTKLEDIKQVYSHPQALMQTRNSIDELLPEVEKVEYANTALAAQQVGQWSDSSKAAIASELAAELYGLEILQRNVEDAEDNTTVFVTMGREPVDPDVEDGPVVTSLLFTARNIPAALYKALGGFATNHVNLFKIESYIPAGESKTAQFFISFEGSPNKKNVRLALEELGFFCKKVKVLGVYHADQTRAS